MTMTAKGSRITRVALVLAMTVIVGATGARAQRTPDLRNFWVLNNTGKVISGLYVSPHSSNTWGPDVLGRAQLAAGIGTIVFFNQAIPTDCVFDFKLTFVGGESQIYSRGRNVCAIEAVQFDDQSSTGLSR